MCDGGGARECGSDREVSDCVLVFVSVLTSVSPLVVAGFLFLFLFLISNPLYLRTFSVSGKRMDGSVQENESEHVCTVSQRSARNCQDKTRPTPRRESTSGTWPSLLHHLPFPLQEECRRKHFLLSPGDEDISIMSFAENACDEGGRKRFAVNETSQGIEVAELKRFFEAVRKNSHRQQEFCSRTISWRLWNARAGCCMEPRKRFKQVLQGDPELGGEAHRVWEWDVRRHSGVVWD